MEEIVRFVNIIKNFPGVLALDNVGFSILKGEIHAIVGENGAGKTTLMNILAGEVHPTSGEIIYKGEHVFIPSPHVSRSFGISVVYQELMLCSNLSIAENIFLGREEKNRFSGRPNWRKMIEESKLTLKILGAELDPRVKVGDLSIARQQIVEIAKAISMKADVLIMDEPTSSLTFKETNKLFDNLRKMKKDGTTIIFISHRLEEVFEIADRISVLRDGKYVGTWGRNDVEVNDIVRLMVGREIPKMLLYEKKIALPPDKIVLEVKTLSRGKFFKNVSFKLYRGEILGIYGLQGAGRTELVETVFGLARASEGEIYIFGEKVDVLNPNEAIKHGLAMVPEDRRRTGILTSLDVKDNIGVVKIPEVVSFGIVLSSKLVDIAEKFINKLNIKVSSVFQMVRNLSGGNQQKVIISRWLAINPKILIVDEITRGIDVGAKYEIYRILQNLRKEGISILFVSSELPEILGECDRIITMCQGKITGEILREEATEEKVLSLAMRL